MVTTQQKVELRLMSMMMRHDGMKWKVHWTDIYIYVNSCQDISLRFACAAEKKVVTPKVIESNLWEDVEPSISP